MEFIGREDPVQKARVEGGGGDSSRIAGGGGHAGGGGAAAGGGTAKEERIQVTVRLRPLNAKELARNDPSDWECINETTIFFRNSLPERSMFPTAYTFDRVFGWDNTTKRVYEEGAKGVALSVVGGINASIFAYGQTSSGKTYTMTGITEFAMTDIYDYTQRHKEREFVLKFSAMEIYNEAVRDLLSADSTPLRLLDDPDRGTTVEKLTEEILRDWDHMKELLSLCEAQRQIGETSLNETSSRSHQILRLSVESSAREFLGKGNSSSLTATVNFVDLAGSERASQAMSAGTRLKEGCHINRSLLTLGTVIRKLSKGRTGHIPYRDSKLTRILQHSLGGNARTAIICTMSPARSHVEQSRNTLLFATCAKEVATSAQVNVVMSDKALVKQLQKELARLESELRCSGLNSNKSFAEALLKDKDAQIQKMEKEIEELTQQRDVAQSRIEDLIRVVGDDGESHQWNGFVQPPRLHVLNTHEDDLHSLCDSSSVLDFGLTMSNASQQSSQSHDSANCSDGPDGYQELSDSTNEYVAAPTRNSMGNTMSGSAPHKDCEFTQDCLDMKDVCKGKVLDKLNEHVATSNEHDATSKQNSMSNASSVGSDPPKDKKLITQDVCLDIKDPGKGEILNNSIEDDPTSNDHDAASIQNSMSNIGSVGSVPHKDQVVITQGDRLDMGLCEEVRCIKIDDTSTSIGEQSRGLLTEGSDNLPLLTTYDNNFGDQERVTTLKGDNNMGLGRSIDHFVKACPSDSSPWPSMQPLSTSRSLGLRRSTSCKASLMNSSTSHWFLEEQNENTPPNSYLKDFSRRPEGFQRSPSPLNYYAENEGLSEDGYPTSGRASLDVPKPENKKTEPVEDITSIRSFVAELKEMARTQFQKQLNDGQVVDRKDVVDTNIEKPTNNVVLDVTNSKESPCWPAEFQRQQREIIELWHDCHVSLVHRTYFFLLFKGDPVDSIYMQVELRRLSFLRRVFGQEHLGKSIVENGCNVTLASSKRALRRERGMLCRQMQKRLSAEERDSLYHKWGVPLHSKQRKMQLIRLLWSDTSNMDHVRESASIIATLIGLLEPDQALKEMFELSFTPQRVSHRSLSWKHGMSSIK